MGITCKFGDYSQNAVFFNFLADFKFGDSVHVCTLVDWFFIWRFFLDRQTAKLKPPPTRIYAIRYAASRQLHVVMHGRNSDFLSDPSSSRPAAMST